MCEVGDIIRAKSKSNLDNDLEQQHEYKCTSEHCIVIVAEVLGVYELDQINVACQNSVFHVDFIDKINVGKKLFLI